MKLNKFLENLKESSLISHFYLDYRETPVINVNYGTITKQEDCWVFSSCLSGEFMEERDLAEVINAFADNISIIQFLNKNYK